MLTTTKEVFEYIKLNATQLHEKLEEIVQDCDAEIETVEEIHHKNSAKDPDVTWGIQGLRRVSVATKKNIIGILTRLDKIGGADVFYLDERGRRQINWESLILGLMDRYIFKTVEDTEELLVYDKGIYRDGSIVVKRYIEERLSDEACLHAVREVIGHIQRRTYIPRSALNEDKGHIPVKNGLINLTTFEREPFDTNKIYTFRIPVTYDQDAGFERIERFFKEVLQPEDVDTMQEIFGYSLYPEMPAHKLFWWLGVGRNGKSTASELLLAMIGAENDAGVSLAQLDGRHRFSVARLFGKLINVVPEPETSTPLQTPVLKAASGGDLLHGELKGVQKVFPFWNFAKFIIFANEIPEIAETSYGFWARALVIDFPQTFSDKAAIKEYHKIVLEEDGSAGLLNWALIGLKRLRANDWVFTTSHAQDDAKLNMQRRSQPVKSFIDDWTEFDIEIEIPKQILFEIYRQYCLVYRIVLIEERDFAQQLQQYANVHSIRSGTGEDRVRGWRGIRMKKDLYRLVTRVNGDMVSAEDALNAEESNVSIKCIPLLAYMMLPTQTPQPTTLYSLVLGVNRVILENKEICGIYKKQVTDSGLDGMSGFGDLKKSKKQSDLGAE
jgi:putative DNA primase/helicase